MWKAMVSGKKYKNISIIKTLIMLLKIKELLKNRVLLVKKRKLKLSHLKQNHNFIE
jgi:hypothetical protein